MSKFFDNFPKINYTVDKKLLNEYELVTNITYRIGIIKDLLENNIGSYYLYSIRDTDRPEIVAEKVYGDPEAHWIIMYTNNIFDPYYDWPMDEKTFEKYLIDKYGSIVWTKTNIHHYEKVVKRENPFAQVIETTRFVVNEKILTNSVLTVSDIETDYTLSEIVYVGPSNAANTFSGQVIAWSNSNGQIVLANTVGSVAPLQSLIGVTSGANTSVVSIDLPSAPMDAYNTLIDTTDFATYNVAGKTVFETISRNKVSYYDYEYELNENKRLIKIIKPEYYQRIVDNFKDITNSRTFYKRP